MSEPEVTVDVHDVIVVPAVHAYVDCGVNVAIVSAMFGKKVGLHVKKPRRAVP